MTDYLGNLELLITKTLFQVCYLEDNKNAVGGNNVFAGTAKIKLFSGGTKISGRLFDLNLSFSSFAQLFVCISPFSHCYKEMPGTCTQRKGFN